MGSLIREKIEEWKKIKIIGIIGLGDMGLLYARTFSQTGWKVVCCDREELYTETFERHKNEPFKILFNGHLVSQISDYIIYSVEVERIDKIVSLYGPSTKLGGIVGGQSSCKYSEIRAFERYLRKDVDIISLHSLHGPNVDSNCYPLVLINHRSRHAESFDLVEALVSCLQKKPVYLSYKEHDLITANTQAVTHVAFLSMGLAYKRMSFYPPKHEINKYFGGLEGVKTNIIFRIYSGKWHVYAGLAITNPFASEQILQYSKSVTELFILFVKRKKEEVINRLVKAKTFVFGGYRGIFLLNNNLLKKDSLNLCKGADNSIKTSNSHLSLLAIVDSWYQLGINPYEHLICGTPLFKIFLGISEYLFLTPSLLEQTIEEAFSDNVFNVYDLEFTLSIRMWSHIVSSGSFELYEKEFEEVYSFFVPMFSYYDSVDNQMINTLINNTD